jgi:hypothetical protein
LLQINDFIKKRGGTSAPLLFYYLIFIIENYFVISSMRALGYLVLSNTNNFSSTNALALNSLISQVYVTPSLDSRMARLIWLVVSSIKRNTFLSRI